jgi:hypothetical protein
MRRTLISALAVVSLIALGACGDDDGATSDGGTTTAAEAPDDGTEPEVPDAEDPADATDPEEAVRWFMDARVAGSGAEAHLTENGATIYPADIDLYEVASYEVGAIEQADANSFEVTVEVTDDEGDTRTETLFVGPGESVDGASLPFAVRGAVSS